MLIVEDGTGLSDANSYSDVEFADSYFNARGISEWVDLEETTKEALLVRATDYLDVRYGTRFKGKRFNPVQALEFPRVFQDEDAQVPTVLKRACCEFALLEHNVGLILNPESHESGLRYTLIRNKIGPIEDEYRFADGSNITQWKAFPFVERMLFPLFMQSADRVIR